MTTILIIDDSATHRVEIRSVLKAESGFDTILEASDGYQGLRMVLAEPVDLVLCDLELPGLDGEKLLRVKASSPGGANTPFIFLTASKDLDRKARLLEAGACDTIAKPFHPADLVARLKLHLKVKRLEDQLREKNQTLERLSSIDSLTGLRTRRFLFELLQVEFMRTKRYGADLSMLMADLDHFKMLNDEYGHLGGDAVLRSVSDSLQAMLRSTDVAGRYGGEELFVLMPQSDLEGAMAVAERWRSNIENTRFQLPGGRETNVTVSIGVAECNKSFESPEDLVDAADQALYTAKKNGRNLVEFYRHD